MASNITFHTFYFAYITNEANQYDQQDHPQSGYIWVQNTGWHFIPNQCIDDFMLPYQWYRLCTAGESFKCVGVSCTVQNMIPLTEQVAIQGNNTFTQFNNTMYALGFNDTLYDTPYNYLNSADYPIQFREGLVIKPDETKVRLQLPTYKYYEIRNVAGDAKIRRWDPFQHPEHLMELRPGKNAISFSWSEDKSDDRDYFINQITMQTSMLPANKRVAGQNYVDINDKDRILYGSLDTLQEDNAKLHKENQYPTIDWKEFFLTPTCKTLEHFNTWMHCNVPFGGAANVLQSYLTDDRYYNKPIPNRFIKLVPLYNAKNDIIPTEAQIGIHKTITWRVRPWRQSNLPTLHQGAISGIDNAPNFHSQDYGTQFNHPMYSANAIHKAADTNRMTRRNPTTVNFP